MTDSNGQLSAIPGPLVYGPNPGPGHFIAIEGMDGAGKTTLVEALRNYLKAQGQDVISVRFPSEWMRGLECFEHVQRQGRLDLFDPVAFEVVYMADRIQLCRSIIEPALRSGKWVIADRYVLSSIGTLLLRLPVLGLSAVRALQSEAWFSDLCRYLIKPSLAVMLHVDPAVGVSRLRNRLDDPDSGAKLSDYSALQQTLLGVGRLNEMALIDGGQPISKMLQDCQKAMQSISLTTLTQP
jgi:dTMP kinase